MIQLRTAIADLLTGDSGVAALVGTRVYHQTAPQDATYPLIVFFKQSGTPSHQFSGAVENEIWTVKAVDPKSSTAEDIADAVDTAMAGLEALSVLRIGDVSYGEPSEGKTYRHLGGMYRIYAE